MFWIWSLENGMGFRTLLATLSLMEGEGFGGVPTPICVNKGLRSESVALEPQVKELSGVLLKEKERESTWCNWRVEVESGLGSVESRDSDSTMRGFVE
ncbi:hypothetical protein FCV25MIE_33019 [Fagus crenata]